MAVRDPKDVLHERGVGIIVVKKLEYDAWARFDDMLDIRVPAPLGVNQVGRGRK